MSGATWAEVDGLNVMAAEWEARTRAGEMLFPAPGFEQEFFERLTEALQRHPLLLEYEREFHAMHASGGFRCTEPWHALGERMVAALMLAHAGRVEQITTALSPKESLGGALAILMATPYLWRAAMVDLANAAPLPTHTVSREALPMPVMFWSLETAYGGQGPHREGEYNWMLLTHTRDGIGILHDFSQPPGTLEIRQALIPYGAVWPHDIAEPFEGVREGVGMVLKMCAFLGSPLVTDDGERMARHQRRRLERAAVPEPEREETVRVVRLRREAKRQTSDGEREVDWHHRWWVSGHYRAQWYPSLDAHRVIWIQPHLKGPADAPLLEKVYDVAQ